MREDYEKLFSFLSPPEPSPDLLEKVLGRLKEKRRAAILKKIFWHSLGVTVSGIALIVTFQMAKADFANSGFWQFFSLIFTDSKILVSYWQNYILSLLETLPAINLILLLGSASFFLILLKYWIKDLKIIFIHLN